MMEENRMVVMLHRVWEVYLPDKIKQHKVLPFKPI